MPYILVEDFKGGLDTRRTNVTSVPGSLVTLTNAHISRGGEIEKRKAFVELATLPVDSNGDPQTVGLAAGGGQIYCFGSDPITSVSFATGTPSNINYIQLRHPEAEASFRVTAAPTGGSVTRIVVDSVDILNANDGTGVVSSAASTALTADAIADQINAYISFDETTTPDEPEYIATSDGDTVIIRGAVAEGESLTITTTSGLTVGDQVDFKSIKMTKLLGVDFFDGYVYSSALFADGKIYHYWEGLNSTNNAGVTPANRVADWFDGRARARFNITAGTAGGTAATGTVTITGGTDNPGDNIRLIRVNGVQIQENSVAHTGDNNTTAAAVAAAINATTSSPSYTATATTNVVTITAGSVGVAFNTFVVAAEVDGAVTTTTTNMSGGVDNAITNITVDGETIIQDPVKWATSNSNTATLVAKAINDHQASPEIEATADGSIVNIIAKNSGTALNQKTVVVSAAGTVTFDQYGLNQMDGGVADSNVGGFTPGGYVMTVKDKMHSVSGSVWHHSDLNNPKEWNSFNIQITNDTVVSGACFAGDLSNSASGSQDLNALANYFQNIAVFAEQAIQIWFVDPDPSKLQQVQVLTNTGTIAPNSVVEFGDSDVFYLDISGIRSLKSRDSSNAAFVEDIGNAIDELIQTEIIDNENAARDAAAILSPRDGRYMLAIGTKVYVFSYYPSSKVSAWSIYEPGFTIQHWAYDGGQVLCRGDDNKLYSLGGANNNTYDSSTVTVQLPFLDGSKPATFKDFTGLDATVENDWAVSIATDPTDITQTEDAGTINKTTYGLQKVSINGYSTHLALKMVCSKAGSAKIGNIAVHYESSEAT